MVAAGYEELNSEDPKCTSREEATAAATWGGKKNRKRKMDIAKKTLRWRESQRTHNRKQDK